jgi:hypothetical protein
MPALRISDARPRTGCYVCRFHGGELSDGHCLPARRILARWDMQPADAAGNGSRARMTNKTVPEKQFDANEIAFGGARY